MSTTVRVGSPVEPSLLDHPDVPAPVGRPTHAVDPEAGAVGVTERTGDQRLGRAVVIGCLIGVVSMTALVFGIGMIAGAGPGASLGLGLFCAVWGGLGFGSMIGAVLVGTRQERRARDAEPDAPISTGLWF